MFCIICSVIIYAVKDKGVPDRRHSAVSSRRLVAESHKNIRETPFAVIPFFPLVPKVICLTASVFVQRNPVREARKQFPFIAPLIEHSFSKLPGQGKNFSCDERIGVLHTGNRNDPHISGSGHSACFLAKLPDALVYRLAIIDTVCQ